MSFINKQQFPKFDRPYINVNSNDPNKVNSLLSKISSMDTQDTLQYSLINKISLGSIINPKDGNNIIHSTISIENEKSEFNRLNFIKFLVQNDVNPDQPNKENQTPLHLACQFQYKTIVDYLLTLGVNTNFKDNNGLTPLHYLLAGDIKLYEDREITDFIIPQPKEKQNKITKKDLLNLKQELWNELKTEPFFEALNKTINDFVPQDTILDFKKELLQLQSGSDYNLINDKYLNRQQKLKSSVEKMWNNFSDSEYIQLHDKTMDSWIATDTATEGIITISDLKKEVKNKIKDTINESIKSIDDYNINVTHYIDSYLSYILVNDLNIRQYLNGNLQPELDKNNFDDAITNPNLYKNSINNNSMNNADNIIEDMYFYGGSRNITIINTNYSNILDQFNTIDKKVLFILLIHIYDINNGKNLIVNEIKKLNDNNLDTILIDIIKTLDPQFNLLALVPFDQFIQNALVLVPAFDLQLLHILDIKRIYNQYYIIKPNNWQTKIYSNYIKSLCRYSSNNLDAAVHILIFRLFNACNTSYNLEVSLNDTLKIDKFNTIIKHFDNEKISLSLWIGYLLDQNNNIDVNTILGLAQNITIDIFKTNINTFDEDIKNIMIGILDITNELSKQLVVEKLNKFYEKMNVKIPKLYFLDAIYYILNSDMFKKIKNNPNNIINQTKQFIDHFLPNNTNLSINQERNYLFTVILSELPPSYHGYIYNLIDTDVIEFNYRQQPIPIQLETHLNSKFRESIELGLLYRGCLPHILKPDNNIFTLNLTFTRNNTTLYFNYPLGGPLLNMIVPGVPGVPAHLNPNIIPLPFNYLYDTVTIPIPDNLRRDYYLYTEYQYRPPTSLSLEYLHEFQIYILDRTLIEILRDNNISYTNLFKSIIDKPTKMSKIYNELYIISKLIINHQKKIISFKNNNDYDNYELFKYDKVKLFQYDNFITNINKFNGYLFLYYYLFKQNNLARLPDFIYYKLDSEKYKLYNNPNLFNLTNLTGGGSKIDFFENYTGYKEIDRNPYLINKTDALPPSLDLILDDFYQYNKLKFIINILDEIKKGNNITIKNLAKTLLEKNNMKLDSDTKESFIYFKIAKLIEDIIKTNAIDAVNLAVKNKMNVLQINPNFRNTVTNSTHKLDHIVSIFNENYDKITNTNKKAFKNFYNIIDLNIKKPCDFILYPNEYTNTSILNQKYCIKLEDDIIIKLLENNAQPYLLDGDNNSCINSVLKMYNHNILQKLKDNGVDFNNYSINTKDTILTEKTVHTNKMWSGSFVKTFENFINPQFESIKNLILAEESNGNNVLANLKNSFYMCFYLMNEYLTDYLWRFDENYTMTNFLEIIALLGYNKDDINKNYISKLDFPNLPNDDITLNIQQFKTILENELVNLNKYKTRLEIEKESINKLNLFSTNIDLKIIEVGNEIAKNNHNQTKLITLTPTKYTPTILNKDKIIKSYDKLSKKGYGIYSKVWDSVLSSEEFLEKSSNLSLLKMLNINDKLEIVEKYFDHISKPAHEYFENPKYTDKKVNKTFCYIYDVLIHLTKTVICFDIEIVIRKIIFNHFKNIYPYHTIDDINDNIDRLFNYEYIFETEPNTFTDILYKIIPDKLVRNSVPFFENIEDKINFEDQSIKDILKNLFALLKNGQNSIVIDDVIMNNINKNVINYFDLIISRTINNWWVICENTLKFVINHHRINKMLLICSESKLSVNEDLTPTISINLPIKFTTSIENYINTQLSANKPKITNNHITLFTININLKNNDSYIFYSPNMLQEIKDLFNNNNLKFYSNNQIKIYGNNNDYKFIGYNLKTTDEFMYLFENILKLIENKLGKNGLSEIGSTQKYKVFGYNNEPLFYIKNYYIDNHNPHISIGKIDKNTPQTLPSFNINDNSIYENKVATVTSRITNEYQKILLTKLLSGKTIDSKIKLIDPIPINYEY